MGICDRLKLPTPEQVYEARRREGQTLAKGLPPALAREERKKTKQQLGKDFRDAVWKRDRSRSRATGKPLVRGDTTDWDRLGEVDHVIDRSLAPERIYDVGNGILLSKRENRLKKVACPRAPELRMFEVHGPDDRSQFQTFIWRDVDGKEVKRRVG